MTSYLDSVEPSKRRLYECQWERIQTEKRISKLHDIIVKKGELFNKSLKAEASERKIDIDKPRYRVIMAPKS